jgi:GT2 family glycosyltransferase
MARVSIVILNWNGRAMTKKCLDNLEKQRFKDFEVILVDNGSTDGSIEYFQDYSSRHYRLTLLAQPENLGFDEGCNVGIRAANSPFVALLNNDALPEPDWLELLVARMEADDQIAIVQPKMLQDRKGSDGRWLIDTTGDFYHIWGAPHPRGRGVSDRGQYDTPEPIFAANAAAALYRASALKTIGLFEPEFFAYFEDVDISFRARLAGYTIWYEPGAVVMHQVGGSSGGHDTNPFTRYHMPKNLWYVYVGNMPTRLFWKYLWRFIFLQIFSWANSFRSGGWRLGWPHTKSWLRAIVMTPKMLVRRRQIQKQRTVSAAEIDRQLLRTVPDGVGPAFRRAFPWLKYETEKR